MKKSKLVLILSAVFAVLFLYYLKVLDQEIANLDTDLLKTSNVIDVTDKIETRIRIESSDITSNEWLSDKFNDSSWKHIILPKFWIAKEPDFKEGNFAFYRIKIPVSLMNDFDNLDDQVSLALYYMSFKKIEIYVNGKLFRKHEPKNHNESVINIPLNDKQDNIVGVKVPLHGGDTGISHRLPIMIGKGSELNALYLRSYKVQTVFTLIYILCKGSILFIFTLIFFLVRVEKYFEKFLMFGIFAVSEDFLRGDYLTEILNLKIRVYIYNLINVGIVVFLFLFLADIVEKKLKRKNILLNTGALILITSILTYQCFMTNYFFSISWLLQFWNVSLMAVLAFFFIPILKKDKVLALVITTAFVLSGWSAFFSLNVGHNLKALGNLLLFFMAAYQTFILFKREQDMLITNQLQMLEQEKDVAIGKTAALLAHDVRRPLEQMNLIINRISEGQADKEFLQTAKRDVEFSLTSVNNQINDIMNFSRRKEIALEAINFYTVLSSSIKQVFSITRNVSIQVHYDFKAEVLVLGDESRLSSALTNLISNAVEAIRDIGQSDKGEIFFKTYLENNHFIFEIENSGPQIPSHIMEDIFKPLYTFGKNKGTGLGLASVLKTLKDHEGFIKVFNVPAGVKFQMSLKSVPQAIVIDRDIFKNRIDDYSYGIKSISKELRKDFRIFLLDDDAQVYDYFRFLVEQLDYNVELTYARNIVEAQSTVKTKRFDLYIIDYDLGQSETGIDFYKNNLSFLKTEVVFHTNRDLKLFSGLSCSYHIKPMPLNILKESMDREYGRRMKILLIDDSELTCLAWEMFHGKHNLKAVLSPEDGIKALENERFDAFVVDYFFENSQMNGLDLYRKIAQKFKSPLVFIATNASIETSGLKCISKNEFELRDTKEW